MQAVPHHSANNAQPLGEERHSYRQFYRPAPNRVPEWLRKIWVWL